VQDLSDEEEFMEANIEQFFRDYVDAFNRSLEGPLDLATIRAAFAPCFVAAGPTGVRCGQNDGSFTEALEQGYAFYRSIGTRRMIFRGMTITEIDTHHRMARVFYSSEYQRRDGELVTIDFDVTYMLHLNGVTPQIFAYVFGDEHALLRQHGLIA
jgi:hypothetical protein